MRRAFHAGFAFAVLLPVFFLFPRQAAAISDNDTQSSTLYRALQGDSRLLHNVSINARNLTISSALALAGKSCHVHLYTNDSELEHSTLGIDVRGQSVAATMDAIAALYLLRWRRDPDRGYELIPGANQFDIFLPHDSFHVMRHEGSVKFLGALANAPASLKSSFGAGTAVPASDLPAPMADAVKTMMQAVNDQYISNGSSAIIDKNDLSNCTVKLDPPRDEGGFTTYFITVHRHGASMGWAFNDYPERQTQIEQNVSSGGYKLLPAPKKFEDGQNGSIKRERLQTTIQISAKNAKFSDILVQLHKTYGLCFACDPPAELSQRSDVNFGPAPLKDLFELLPKIYKDTEWECRESGIIILRGPLNPARDPSKGQIHNTYTSGKPS